MASIVRPSVFRHVCRSAGAKRVFSTQPIVPSALKTTQSIISKPTIRSAFAKQPLPNTVRVAAFHASGRQAILPPGPQVINGTANDAAVVPPPSPSHGSYHWTFERLIAVAIIPLTVAPFVGGTLNPVMDAILCGTILIHSHIGFESCIIDYFPNKRVPKTRTTMNWALKASTLLVGVGLYEFETNDVGVTEAIKRIWTA